MNWLKIFEGCEPQSLEALRDLFGFPASISLTPSAFIKALEDLPDEAFGRFDEFVRIARKLADPDNRYLNDALADCPTVDVPALPSAFDRAIWLRSNHPDVIAAAADLLEFDRRFQRDAYWNGFDIEGVPDTDNLKRRLNEDKARIAKCFGEPGRPPPDIRIEIFRRSAGRSHSEACVCTIAVEGALDKVSGFGREKTEFIVFHPEWMATIVIDEEQQRFDMVSERHGKTLRCSVLSVVADHLGVKFDSRKALKARFVDLSRLKRRCSLSVEPEDGLSGPPCLVAATIVRGNLGLLRLDSRASSTNDAWAEFGAYTSSEGNSFLGANVVSAGFEFEFRPRSGKGSPKRRFVHLTRPNGMTLRAWPQEHRDIADRVFRRNGIIGSKPPR